MSQNLTDNKLTLVQVMAWCRQQASTSTTVNQDLQRLVASLGPNDLISDDVFNSDPI